MSDKIVEVITDKQLSELEKAACRSYSESTLITRKEVESIITRLRAAEKDAARYRFLCDPDGADEISLSVAIDILNSWSDKSEIDEAVDHAMEHQP